MFLDDTHQPVHFRQIRHIETAQLVATYGSSPNHLLVRLFRRPQGRNFILCTLNPPFSFLQIICEGGRLLNLCNESGLERLQLTAFPI